MFVPLIVARKPGGGLGSGVILDRSKIAKRTSASLLDRDI